MKKMLYLMIIVCSVSCGNLNSQIIEDLDIEAFHLMLNKGDGIIIDVRTAQEFSSGHITEATNIDYYSEQFLEKLNIVRRISLFIYTVEVEEEVHQQLIR